MRSDILEVGICFSESELEAVIEDVRVIRESHEAAMRHFTPPDQLTFRAVYPALNELFVTIEKLHIYRKELLGQNGVR